MKNRAYRILSLALVLALALSLAACGGSASGAASSQAASSPASSSSSTYSKGLDENGYWAGITALDYVTLPKDYASPVLPADVVTADPAMVESTLQAIPYDFATTAQVTDRAVEQGDMVNIDYVGSVDGVEFDGGSTGGAGTTVMAGATNYIDDFLTQIIGHMPGETIDVNVTFPDPYENNPDLAGKDALFVTTINYIEESIVPELNDAFVAENLAQYYDGIQTVEELSKIVEDTVRENQILTYLTAVDGYMSSCTFADDLPESLITYEEELCLDYYRTMALQNGFVFSDFLTMYFGEDVTTEEDLLELQKDSILEGTRQYLMFQAIAEAEGFSLTDEEATTYMCELLGTDDLSYYVENYGMPYLKYYTMYNMILDLLIENAVEG